MRAKLTRLIRYFHTKNLNFLNKDSCISCFTIDNTTTKFFVPIIKVIFITFNKARIIVTFIIAKSYNPKLFSKN